MGGGGGYATHITNAKPLTARIQGSCGSTERFRILDALSCYLSLIWKHSVFKTGDNNKNIIDQTLGGWAPVAPPPGSATVGACSQGN